jgi:ABC-type Fe3+ transport system substrate-binding protein
MSRAPVARSARRATRRMVPAGMALSMMLVAACGGGEVEGAVGDAPSTTDSQGSGAGGGSSESEWDSLEDLVAAAEADGELNFVGSAVVTGGQPGMDVLEAALNDKYGIDVSLNFLPGPSMTEAATRVVQEVQAGQPAFTDILWSPNSGSGSNLHEFARQHPVELFDKDELPPEEAFVYDNRAIQVMTDFPGIVYNTDVISEDEAPSNLDEFVDPKWEGMIAAGTGGAVMYYLPFLMPEDEALDYVERLAALDPGLIRCGEDARTASGEFPLFGLSCGEYGVRQLQKQGAPIAARILEDACILLKWHLLVPETSQRPALAHLFSMFLASPEGQEAYWEAAMVNDVFWDTPMKEQLEEVQSQGIECVDTGGEFTQENAAEIQGYRERMTTILGG